MTLRTMDVESVSTSPGGEVRVPDGWVRGPDRRFLSKISKIDNKSPRAHAGGGGSKLWNLFAPDRVASARTFPQNSENFFLPSRKEHLRTRRSRKLPELQPRCAGTSQTERPRK